MPSFNYQGTLIARQESDSICWEHIRPSTPASIAELIHNASQSGTYIVSGTPSAVPQRFAGREILFIDQSGTQQIIEHQTQDQVASVCAGITIRELDQLLASTGQWWPVSAPPATTVASVIECGEGGCLEHGFGGPRDLVLGLSVALASGDIINCGGKVVKNVSGYDLQKLFIGSRGWLGIVLTAHLRLFPRPESSHTICALASTPAAAFATAANLIKSGISISALELVDSTLLAQLSGQALSQQLRAQPGTTAVLVQISGQEAVLAAALKVIHEELSQRLTCIIDLDAHELWQKLSCTKEECGLASVEAAATASQMLSILQTCFSAGPPLWQCRPARGRLKLFSADASAIKPWIETLRLWTEKQEQTLAVAYCDPDWQWKVILLPSQDSSAAALKQAIKQQFDPSGCLNPLVSL